MFQTDDYDDWLSENYIHQIHNSLAAIRGYIYMCDMGPSPKTRRHRGLKVCFCCCCCCRRLCVVFCGQKNTIHLIRTTHAIVVLYSIDLQIK